MKKLFALILFLCLIPVVVLADGFGITVPEFIEQYNDYSYDKTIEDISNGKVFGEGDTQYIRLKADDGVEIFLRYSDNVESELLGIIIMQRESSTDFEKLLSVATSTAYILSKNITDDATEIMNHPYRAVCETIAYYGYSGESVPVSVTGYTAQYQIDGGTRQLYIAPREKN